MYVYIYTAQWNTNDEMKYNRIKALTVPRISLLQLYANLWNEMCIPLELCWTGPFPDAHDIAIGFSVSKFPHNVIPWSIQNYPII